MATRPEPSSAARCALRAAAALLVLGVAACSTSGSKFSADDLPRVVEGRSTQEDVREIFGEPISVRFDSGGRSTYRYHYTERTSADTGFISRIGVFIARVFGAWVPYPPFGVRHVNEIRHDLLVAFDSSGVVEHYTYERSEKPTTEVY